MAIDYGAKRIGLAVSDPLGYTAQPLPFLRNNSWTQVFVELKKIAAEKSVARILVGLPKSPDGGEGVQAKSCRDFSVKLGEELGLPVELVDETMTSREAREILIGEMDASRATQKSAVDSLSACLLLKSYLERPEK